MLSKHNRDYFNNLKSYESSGLLEGLDGTWRNIVNDVLLSINYDLLSDDCLGYISPVVRRILTLLIKSESCLRRSVLPLEERINLLDISDICIKFDIYLHKLDKDMFTNLKLNNLDMEGEMIRLFCENYTIVFESKCGDTQGIRDLKIDKIIGNKN